jgi:hypothetical protein
MANVYKVLGQSSPNATTNTDLYTVPALTSTVASTLTICNRGSATVFRVAVRPSGSTISNLHYIVYDAYINANDTVFLTLGLTLATTDVVTVYSGTANLSFGLYGQEIS